MSCENVGQDYRHVGTDSIIPGDWVSWIDKTTQRRRFGHVMQVMPDYTMRINYSGKVVRIADRDITKEEQ